MEVDFLLIGKGLTGQIKRYDYPRDKLRVTELTVESANEPVIVRPVLVFDVIQHKFDGKTYAVAIGASTDSVQINALIDRLKQKWTPTVGHISSFLKWLTQLMLRIFAYRSRP
ncbi:hypothetical protein, partial [Klebsiella pneumoniae]